MTESVRSQRINQFTFTAIVVFAAILRVVFFPEMAMTVITLQAAGDFMNPSSMRRLFPNTFAKNVNNSYISTVCPVEK